MWGTRYQWFFGWVKTEVPKRSLNSVAAICRKTPPKRSLDAAPSRVNELSQLLLQEPLLQRRHINHEAVLHIALRQPFIGLVNVLNFDQFNVRGDAVLGAEIEHLLRFANASNGGTRQTVSPNYQIEGSHWSGFLRRAYQRHGAVELKKWQVRVEVVFGGCGVENEV